MASSRKFSRAVSGFFNVFLDTSSRRCKNNSIFRKYVSYRIYSPSIYSYAIHSGTRQTHIGWRGLGGAMISQGFSSQHIEETSSPSTRDPYSLIEPELATLYDDIRKELRGSFNELQSISHYHFDGKGKAFRPMVVMLVSKACNIHNGVSRSLVLASQRTIAMIAEMIHTASLLHDDVIDVSETRRGFPTVQKAWGQRKDAGVTALWLSAYLKCSTAFAFSDIYAYGDCMWVAAYLPLSSTYPNDGPLVTNAILTGDFIIAISTMALARIRNEEVVKVLSQVLEDLVRGEFMQLGSKEDEAERFNHYLQKTFRKTASLIACSCRAVAILGECAENIIDIAYHYGRNLGIAFQLVDDLLDFISSEAIMGKPAVADLKLGLATAPVLFAAEQYPELNAMIMRRFSKPGDVDRARLLVHKSNGVEHTRQLAQEHCREAVRMIKHLKPSLERDALITLTEKVLSRLK